MRASAAAKINLALVVGPTRDDGKHEVATVYQRLAIADRLELESASELLVEGFDADTLVRGAL
jgi:4-diphosphocytidyl-2-C-methyl-D-erythritol kinase